MVHKLIKNRKTKRLKVEFSREWTRQKGKSIKIRDRGSEKQEGRFEEEIKIVTRVDKGYWCIDRWKETWEKTAARWLACHEGE